MCCLPNIKLEVVLSKKHKPKTKDADRGRGKGLISTLDLLMTSNHLCINFLLMGH